MAEKRRTIQEIAAEHGFTDQAVRVWAHKAGFETPRGKGLTATFTAAEEKQILAQRKRK